MFTIIRLWDECSLVNITAYGVLIVVCYPQSFLIALFKVPAKTTCFVHIYTWILFSWSSNFKLFVIYLNSSQNGTGSQLKSHCLHHVSVPFGNQFNYSLKGHLGKVQVSKKDHLNQAHLNINSVRSEVWLWSEQYAPRHGLTPKRDI